MTPFNSQIVADWGNETKWSTADARPDRQFDIWRGFVNEALLPWNIRRVRVDGFPALVRHGRCNGIRITDQKSEIGGVVGTRGPMEIAQTTEPTYNFIYLLSGAVRVEMDSAVADLGADTCVMWDSSRPLRFSMGPKVRQITFSVPRQFFRSRVANVDLFVGRAVATGVSSSMRLFADHLVSLDRAFGDLTHAEATPILDATCVMLAAALESTRSSDEAVTSSLLDAICARVRKDLGDPSLTISRVAAMSGLSERHLYRVFASIGTTPSAWIRRERLKECHRELSSASFTHQSVMEIATRWGFGDAGSFAKIFRRAYGQLPSSVRDQVPPFSAAAS